MTSTQSADLDALRTLDTLSKGAGADLGRMIERCDDLYDQRVRTIMTETGCSSSVAHSHAARDEIAKRAYSLGIELRERRSAVQTAAANLASTWGR